jgi:hypothetical protein
LTLVMSTFRLNSGGNLVCLSSLASTLDAMFAIWGRELDGEGKKGHEDGRVKLSRHETATLVGFARRTENRCCSRTEGVLA